MSKAGARDSAIEYLGQFGVEAYPAGWDERVALVRLLPYQGMGGVARALSLRGGQVWLSGSGSCCWVLGSRRVWLLREELEGVTLRARAVVEGLGVEPAPTVGGCARALLGWVGEVRSSGADAELLMRGADWHYFRVEAGSYGGMHLLDIDSAYYQLLCRVPTPAVHVWRDGSVRFGGVSRSQLSRWWQVLDAVRGEKLLRNALVGAGVGRDDGAVVFVRGEVRTVSVHRSGWRVLGWLVVRSVYELCGAGCAEVGGVYANTDCVICDASRDPSVWQGLGVRYSERARGEAEVYGVGVYRVGEEATVWYRLGLRPLSSVRTPPPAVQYARWLASSRVL
jgi:hypothetical protein